MPGYTLTTAIVPTGPNYGGMGGLGFPGGFGGAGGLPPKIRAIFIPQGGASSW